MSKKLLMNKVKAGVDEIEPNRSGLVGWLDIRNQSGTTWKARIGNDASLREFVTSEGFIKKSPSHRWTYSCKGSLERFKC